MHRTCRLLTPLLFDFASTRAQTAESWNQLRNYGEIISVDSNFCAPPDTACLMRYFTESVYGHTPRRMSYEGIPAPIDSAGIEQVYETLNTYRWIERFSRDKYTAVNVPSATLRVVSAQGVTLLDSRVVVGKSSIRTPSFAALVPGLILYPYWNVSRSITGRGVLPKIRRDPAAVLEAQSLHIIDAKGKVVDPAPGPSKPFRIDCGNRRAATTRWVC